MDWHFKWIAPIRKTHLKWNESKNSILILWICDVCKIRSIRYFFFTHLLMRRGGKKACANNTFLSICHTQLNNWIEGTISEVNCNPILWAMLLFAYSELLLGLLGVLLVNVTVVVFVRIHFLLNDFIIQIDVIFSGFLS